MFYDLVMKALPGILSKAGSKTPFKARAFQELIATARDIAKRMFS